MLNYKSYVSVALLFWGANILTTYTSDTQAIQALEALIQKSDAPAFQAEYEQFDTHSPRDIARPVVLFTCLQYLQGCKKEKTALLAQDQAAYAQVCKTWSLSIGGSIAATIICGMIGTASVLAPLHDENAVNEGVVYGGFALIPAVALGYWARKNWAIWTHATQKCITQEIQQLETIEAYIQGQLFKLSINTDTPRHTTTYRPR